MIGKTLDYARYRRRLPRVPDSEVLRAHDVLVASDNDWQRRARLLQALWRGRQGLPAGEHRGRPLGSQVRVPDGEPPKLANYLTATIKQQVVAALEASRETGALFARPRLWVNLLSSQPLCFNLFGELAADLPLATTVLRMLWPDRIERVTEISFEYSPGRGAAEYTGNRSAFDVFIRYEGATGMGFLAVEVKYHEDLVVSPAQDPTGRYAQLAAETGAFRSGSAKMLSRPPLQQLWLDHLLALRMTASQPEVWGHGMFVLLYPAANVACATAAARYRQGLLEHDTFDARTLEEIVSVIRYASGESWADQLYERYLNVSWLVDAGMLRPG